MAASSRPMRAGAGTVSLKVIIEPGRRPSRAMLITSGEREFLCVAIQRSYDPCSAGQARMPRRSAGRVVVRTCGGAQLMAAAADPSDRSAHGILELPELRVSEDVRFAPRAG